MTTEPINIIEEIRQAWGWAGLNPVEIVEENAFGNLLVKDANSKYWRICPEDGYCCIVASGLDGLASLVRHDDFLHDWQMTALAKLAREKLGPLPHGSKYCLKVPTQLGGGYSGDNLGIAPLAELIRYSGALAKSANVDADADENDGSASVSA
jgi:hypothetical protein